jgi:hypothetical protein
MWVSGAVRGRMRIIISHFRRKKEKNKRKREKKERRKQDENTPESSGHDVGEWSGSWKDEERVLLRPLSQVYYNIREMTVKCM